MHGRGIKFQKVIRLNSVMTAGEAHKKLKLYKQDYGLVEEDGKILGFFYAKPLTGVKTQNPVKDFISPLMEQAHGPFQELIHKFEKGLVLLCDEPAGNLGVVNYKAVETRINALCDRERSINTLLDAVLALTKEEIYIADSQGITLKVSNSFMKNAGVPVENVIGKNVFDLEKEGIFRPSVTRIVLKEKREVTVLQTFKNGNEMMVMGFPVYNEKGGISWVISISHETEELRELKEHVQHLENLKDQYYQEFFLMQNRELKSEAIVAESSAMIKVLHVARNISSVDSRVLLLGETGVGKGVLAYYIHKHSPRQDKPLITVNCGAIPENLLESELFGYEPGSFTGASRQGKIGKIELANQGTLFLDEIGDLPLPLQVKLLHVIEEGTITRIGGSKEIKLDVRFLAATNLNLSSMVDKGLFRKDLYYRLNVLPLEIPPLRYRKEDIVALTNLFLKKFNQKFRKQKIIDPETFTYLQNYEWPGNVRELENIIERLVIVTNADKLEPYHLPEYIKNTVLRDVMAIENFCSAAPLEKIKDDLEKAILEQLYAKTNNTYKMADLLKISQSTVVRKLQKYGIRKEEVSKTLDAKMNPK